MTFSTKLARAAFTVCLLAGPNASAQNADTQPAQDAVPLEERGYALGDMAIGAEDAPVEILEYSSLLCPHCADFHTDTWPEVKAQFVDNGQARLIFRDVIGNQVGLWATMLVRCGGEEAFWESLAIFMAQQSSFIATVQGEGAGPALQQAGRLLGLSPQRLQQCLSDEEYMTRIVEDLQRNMAERDVEATPTFFINGDKYSGNRPPAEFGALIEGKF
jgi:protein-disulfide isomerase